MQVTKHKNIENIKKKIVETCYTKLKKEHVRNMIETWIETFPVVGWDALDLGPVLCYLVCYVWIVTCVGANTVAHDKHLALQHYLI